MELKNVDLSAIPEGRRAALHDLVEILVELALDDLVALTAFGGWRIDDPCYADAPARTVLILRELNLLVLERLADRGTLLGSENIAAPLIMTPAYIRDSCDVFPLEFLEIQETRATLFGDDPFADLTLAEDDIRLACERELKSELIHMRQGLLASINRAPLLHQVSRAGAERATRILRGLLFLRDVREVPAATLPLIRLASDELGIELVTLLRYAEDSEPQGIDGFRRLYAELAELAAYTDSYGAGASGR